MSTSVSQATIEHAGLTSSAQRFAAVLVVLTVSLALLAGLLPLSVSIVGVFLFAGPHNWMEARYFLARMPPRWGALWIFFTIGIVGTVALTASFALLPYVAREWRWSAEQWDIALSSWNTLLALWIAALALLRAGQNPRRDWSWLPLVTGGVVALAWLWPLAWDLSLVYVHPLVALWFLDRELGRQHSAWRGVYRRVLPLVPICVALLAWQLAGAADLSGDDALSWRITQHAGADIVRGVSTHFLVATHVFLESLHYAVWLLAIPLVTFTTAPWHWKQIPLARRGGGWTVLVKTTLLVGATLTVLFWAGFSADYAVTRDIYFTVAMLHVLAEVPFLLRLL